MIGEWPARPFRLLAFAYVVAKLFPMSAGRLARQSARIRPLENVFAWGWCWHRWLMVNAMAGDLTFTALAGWHLEE